jgi:hypothetical protein
MSTTTPSPTSRLGNTGRADRAERLRPAAVVAVTASAAVIALEAWDAFHISQPLGAVIAIVAFAAGIAWLRMRGGRGPAIYLGVLFALEIIGNFTIFGVLDDLRHRNSWADFASGVGYTAATIAGLIACLALSAARTLAADR